MTVTPSGIFTDLSEVQPAKALEPMLFTLSGSLTLTMSVLPSNALEPIAVTGLPLYVSGTMTSLSVQLPIPIRV